MTGLLALFLALFVPAGPPAGGLGTVAGTVTILRKGVAAEAANTVVWIENLKVSGGGNDAIYHNVFSVSPANRFDLGLYRSGGSKQKRFDEPGLVRVYCNIHPQMVGFVMVVDSDFAAVTGADGTFRFENVPAGTWTVKVWNEEGGEAASPIAVRAGAQTPAAFQLDATAFRREPHKNKYGKEYPPQAGADDERY
jgi:hypothetical protein